MQQVLVTALEMSPKLRTMAQTPLLLTLMAVVLYNKGELPRDRPQLYERILELLLGQWDQVRDGPSLAQAIGLPGWGSERLRPLLDQLSYAAHAGATSADGRGRLDRGTLYAALIDFFQAAAVTGPGEAALRCLAYIDHRSGLLTPDTDDTYAFAHLTLQEHCAGRAMLLARDAADQVMQQRADDRWREPIFLGLGVVQQTNPWLIESVLRKLLDPEANDQPKPVARWYRDLILAAEIGADRDWAYLREQRVDVSPLQRDLKCGLVDLLADRSQPLPVAERIRAGDLLGDLGDPRVPVTVEEWQRELAQRSEQFSVPAGYFCAVRPDTYQIGGWEQNQASANIALPAFWIARFPVTVAQYAPFVAEGYGPDAERWWTREGWQWKRDRTEPWGWNEPPYDGPNQPVIGVTWYEARAFCAWLTEQMQDALPNGYVIRLPTEAEWEAAAAYDAQMQRRFYPWGEEEPTSDHAIFEDDQGNNLGRPAPVGCCPVGAAACGGLDMAGNVWEVTTSSHGGYPAQSGRIKEDFTSGEYDVPWRGGSWWNDSTYVRCGARDRNLPVFYNLISDLGFRVVVAPLLAHMS
jgi:formylglycine-generating enzyme required for sulfatase activity